MRPIVRIADVLSGPFRRAGPSRPEEERIQRLSSGGILQGIAWNGVIVAQLFELRVMTEQARIIPA
ncbi:hypothetical protein D3C81_774570 [compost metagenome]